MSIEKITPPEILERPESALSEPDPEPHQHGEPGHPETVDVPQTLPQSMDLHGEHGPELEIPPGLSSIVNALRAHRIIE